ncbi:MAG: hypothetical protein ACRD96_23505, partial [Bryobacteraceae bacterium]
MGVLLAMLAIETAIGVTDDLRPIRAVITADDLDYSTKKTRILLVGAEELVRPLLRAPRGYAISAVMRQIDGPFPPPGEAYRNEAQYLWRWIAMHAPDLVVEVREGPGPAFTKDGELVRALEAEGSIPALRATIPRGADLLSALGTRRGPSRARREMQKRVARSPAEVARQLAVHYGHNLEEAVYIPAVALIGRLRLGALEDVERIVAPYFSGAKPSLGPKPTGSHLSGHLVFGELFERTRKPRYLDLVRAAADMG